MKKNIILLPIILGLSGCVFLSPEQEAFQKEHQLLLEKAGLIGQPQDSKLFDDLWENTKGYECGTLFYIDRTKLKFTIEGAAVGKNTNPEKCEPYFSNLKYYVEHGKTKAEQKREDAIRQRKIEAQKQIEADKAYAKEQYRLAKQSKTSSERIDHLEKASIYGNAQASYELFRHYLPVNEYLAEQYLKKAAFNGHATANIIMGGRFAKSARYNFSDNIHAYVFYKRAQRYGSKEAATLAKGIENRFKARIQQGSEEAEYLWRNAQRAASF